jgi:hypothetical protein
LRRCSKQSSTICKEVQLSVTPDYGASLQLPFHCARHGQIEAQKWLAEHPTWRIEKWSCYPSGKVRLKVLGLHGARRHTVVTNGRDGARQGSALSSELLT